MKTPQIVMMKTTDLVPYENNPRKNDDAVQYVANSIREFGFKVPIVIDKENVIIAGHTRLKAAESLGIEEVPCIVANDLTEAQIKAFRLADNKTGEMAGWDFSSLDLELADLKDLDFDMSGFGFDSQEFGIGNIDDLFEDAEPKEEEPKQIQCPHCGQWFAL